MVWKRTFNKAKPKYRTSRDPEYYHRKLERLRMNAPPPSPAPPLLVLPVPVPAPKPLATEKKKPGRKKKVTAPRAPITREEKEIIVYFQ